MSAASWLRTVSTRTPHKPAGATRRAAFRPRLEVLEGRSLPSFGWAGAVGGDTGNAVATDAAGNVYMAETFTNSFNPAGSSIPLTSAGGSDIFVAKYSRVGAFVWAVSMGGAQKDSASGIAVDGTGANVDFVGQYAGAYVAQLNAATGAVNWSRTVSGTAANAVAVDGAGAVYVTSRQGSVLSATSRYVTKLDAGGTRQWQDTITSAAGVPSDAGVAVTGTTVYVGGVYVTSATFAIGASTYSVTTARYTDAGYVLKLSSDDAYGWVQTFQGGNGGGDVTSNSIAADGSGNVYAFGEFVGKVSFGASTTLNAGKSNDAYFVAKLTPAGTVAWAKQFGSFPGLSGGAASAIAVDGAGAVYLTGSFIGTVSFNPAGGGSLTSAGGNDIFVSKLDTNGTFQWAVSAGGTGDDFGNGIAVDGFGDIYIAGSIAAGTADFDPTHTYPDNRDLVTTAAATGFLWQITQP
jgi:hypothetical protein